MDWGIKLIKNSKQFLIRITVIYSAIFFLFIAIPAYFYTKLEIENHTSSEKRLLFEHAQKIQRAIYDFSNSKSSQFIFPKSFKFGTVLLDAQGKVVYKASHIKNLDERISLDFELVNNRLNANRLIVSTNIRYDEIYLKILLLTICVGLFIFISIFLLIQASVEPYKNANEYLDAFFNDAMHELKTPLGVIQLNLEMLEAKQAQSKELQRSINAAKNLFFIYEDIEYLIKQKRVRYNKESLDFSYLLSQRVDQFESLTYSKKLQLNIDIDPSVSIEINRIHLQRIIDNTLSNAIKYSYKETTIYVSLKKDAHSTIFSVQNSGPVIQDTQSIFNRYYKENSIKGGFGIGLNIVKNICDTNEIQIICTSTKNTGTLFKYIFKS